MTLASSSLLVKFIRKLLFFHTTNNPTASLDRILRHGIFWHPVKGNKPQIVAVIPARYASTRLPGKPLLDLAGKPIIQHVYAQACQAKTLTRILIATDDQRIADVVRGFGGEVVMTSSEHQTGTDRIAEVAGTLSANIIVNIQGDEPFISPITIDQAVQPLLDDPEIVMSTTAEKLTRAADLLNPNVVKVVMDKRGNALYFSRAVIPFPRALIDMGAEISAITMEQQPELLAHYYKHTGLYVYRHNFLLQFITWPRTALEKIESLEQLRVLEHGHTIRVIVVEQHSMGIDTATDLAQARQLLANNKTEIY